MATQYLTGRFDNGSESSDTQGPADARQPLRIVQGESLTLYLNVRTPDGVPIKLAEISGVVSFYVKKKWGQAAADYTVLGTLAPTRGVDAVTFQLATATTKRLTPGRWSYSVWVVHAGGRDAVIPTSELIVEPGLST